VKHGVEVVVVMAAGTGGGSGVRSDVLLAFPFFQCFANAPGILSHVEDSNHSCLALVEFIVNSKREPLRKHTMKIEVDRMNARIMMERGNVRKQ
jgi:hypothetical protein